MTGYTAFEAIPSAPKPSAKARSSTQLKSISSSYYLRPSNLNFLPPFSIQKEAVEMQDDGAADLGIGLDAVQGKETMEGSTQSLQQSRQMQEGAALGLGLQAGQGKESLHLHQMEFEAAALGLGLHPLQGNESNHGSSQRIIQVNQEDDALVRDGDLENFEEGYRRIESVYHNIISSWNGGFTNSILSARFVDGVRRLQVQADYVEKYKGLKPLHTDYPLPSKHSYQRTLSDPTMMKSTDRLETPQTQALEVIKNAIGASCGNYTPLSGRFGELGDGIVSGTKRKICENSSCATRRHKVTVRADADRIGEWILSTKAEDLLPMVWVHLQGGDEIKLTGYDIRDKLLSNSALDLTMADALVRMLREHEAQTLFVRDAYPGRHFASPVWGINVAQGTTCMASSLSRFMFPTPRYDIKRCSIVLTLICHNGEWSCYAFDFNRCVVSIMDPNIRHPVEQEKIQLHTEFTGRLLTHVVFCMRMVTGNITIGRAIWTPKLLIGHGRRTHTTTNSGIAAINCMRWYNGNSVCTPPKDRLAINTRKDLALQLISMETNAATTPVLRFALRSSRAPDQGHQCKSSSKHRHEGGEGGSNTMSGGA